MKINTKLKGKLRAVEASWIGHFSMYISKEL
jgi:hypothetical protein